MAKASLSDPDHVVRHISSQLLERDGNGRVVGCFPQAFQLRDGEKYLSASWLEFFEGTKSERIKQTVAACGKTRTVRSGHGFAIGNVKEIKMACQGFRQRINVVHESDKGNPAYVAVRNYRSDDIGLLDLLAAEAWADVIEAKDFL
jgi:hypothetical protein